ncbi:hypothetical protein ACI65C_001875 [Semiaphis heraclei]
MLFILNKVISSAVLANRRRIGINDFRLAIRKAKDRSIPLERSVPILNTRTGSIPKKIAVSIPNTRVVLIPMPRTDPKSKTTTVLITKTRTGSISKARASTIPRFSPHNNADQDINMIETPDYELTNDMLGHSIQTQFNEKFDNVLPELSDLDIEEVIGSLPNIQDSKQDSQNVTTYKFNVGGFIKRPLYIVIYFKKLSY